MVQQDVKYQNNGQGGTIKKKMYEVNAEIWAIL